MTTIARGAVGLTPLAPIRRHAAPARYPKNAFGSSSDSTIWSPLTREGLGLSDDALDTFAAELVRQLAYAADAQPSRSSEAQRLLVAREYRAAVMAAMSGLEVVLQKYVGSEIRPTMSIGSHRSLPMRMMLDHALEMGLISEVEQRHIREWMGVRNTAIHEGEAVSAAVAKSIVDGVNRIVGKITGQT